MRATYRERLNANPWQVVVWVWLFSLPTGFILTAEGLYGGFADQPRGDLVLYLVLGLLSLSIAAGCAVVMYASGRTPGRRLFGVVAVGLSLAAPLLLWGGTI